MDDLELSSKIPAFFGIEANESAATDQKIGDERLGSKESVFANFGPTLILASCVFVFIILLVTTIYIICKRTNCSKRSAVLLRKLQEKVFWNPIIRYVYLNGLKLSMASLLVIKENKIAGGALATLLIINLSAIFFVRALKKNEGHLDEVQKVKTMGSLYAGKNTYSTRHHVHLYPAAFFLRRTLFAVATVFLFVHPILQMISHYLLTMFFIVYLAFDTYLFENRWQVTIEIGSEFFMHFISVLLSQFMVQSYSKDTKDACETATIAVFGLLFALNISFAIRTSILSCKEKKHKKELEKRRKAMMEKREKNRDIKK